MNKQYCDICGKDITGNVVTISINEPGHSFFGGIPAMYALGSKFKDLAIFKEMIPINKKYEMCKNCAQDIANFIEGG